MGVLSGMTRPKADPLTKYIHASWGILLRRNLVLFFYLQCKTQVCCACYRSGLLLFIIFIHSTIWFPYKCHTLLTLANIIYLQDSTNYGTSLRTDNQHSLQTLDYALSLHWCRIFHIHMAMHLIIKKFSHS